MDTTIVHALNQFLLRHDGVEDPVTASTWWPSPCGGCPLRRLLHVRAVVPARSR